MMQEDKRVWWMQRQQRQSQLLVGADVENECRRLSERGKLKDFVYISEGRRAKL
jgi:hypothetical protein